MKIKTMAGLELSNFTIRMVLIVIAIVVLFILIVGYHKKRTALVVAEEAQRPKFETFQDAPMPSAVQPSTQHAPAGPVTAEQGVAVTGVRPSEDEGNEDYKAVDFNTENKIPSDCFPRDKLTVEDLLPKDAANSTWAQVNPAGQGDVKDQNFLTAGHHIGINTVGQSLRNPNLQLRSDPPNPKIKVSPWNQSTIEYDVSRRYFEVGEC